MELCSPLGLVDHMFCKQKYQADWPGMLNYFLNNYSRSLNSNQRISFSSNVAMSSLMRSDAFCNSS